MLVGQVRDLGLDVLLSRRIEKIDTDDDENVTGLTFEGGETMECSCVCFAIGIKPRDDIARDSGIECEDRSGGVIVDKTLSTSAKDVYAIGECASWNSQTYGLIAPGIEVSKFDINMPDRSTMRAQEDRYAFISKPRTTQRPHV